MKTLAFSIFTLIFGSLFLSSSIAAPDKHSASEQNWSEEQLEIIELNRFVALAPKQVGYEAYAELFHPDFTNWYMAGDKKSLRSRAEYLSLVSDWLHAGNYATFSKVDPISIDVLGDLAYVRQVKEEHFYHPDQPPTKFVGHFASLMKKHNGKWTFYRTSFDTRFRGPFNDNTN
ncbi:nuclear transport factor 2 family protein [Planctobacterium marinum]|uniref:DUF4440 domain-containing protein n=1 Tax=Planctobacterium marinum TaxID=1631968 RepID=A0AA48KPV2_9ALTE|nr:hypothetical protein MACH26_13740 [Planctobacterium marinum]